MAKKVRRGEMKRIIITLLSIIALNCYSQETWTMQIWNKDGSKAQYDTDNIDSITVDKRMLIGKWDNTIICPTLKQISIDNDTSSCKAPYITAVLKTTDIDSVYRGFTDSIYIGFSIDFKADFLPLQTYCCLASFTFDYSSIGLEYDSIKRYSRFSGYAGFQRVKWPKRPEYNSILSLWDNYCFKGENIDTIVATQIAPNGEKTQHFNNEGEYVNFSPEYLWEPGKWYRMLLLLGTSETIGKTTIEQKVYNLETKESISLCTFDLGFPNLKFKGDMYCFLEDWLPETAGEIRTLEIKNAKILTLGNKWKNVNSAYLTDRQEKNFSGSHNFGKDESSFWMITTGVPDCAANPKPITLTVENSEEGDPEIIK